MTARAVVVVGLFYGDEGKGQVVDHIVREHDVRTVMRFSGGCQAAHNVIAPDGRHHTFAQFGSGTFAGARTYLGGDMMVNPLDMFNEYYHLASIGEGDVWDRLSVNKGCLVTTPIHEAATLLREYFRRGRAHGTTGKGIGQTRSAWIHGGVGLQAGTLPDRAATKKTLERLISYYGVQAERWEYHPVVRKSEVEWSDSLQAARELLQGYRPDFVEKMVDRYAEWAARTKLVDNVHLSNLLRNSGTVVLEGSQGVLLDERMGFHPHTTWSDVTPGPARRELTIAGVEPNEVETIGVVRSYTTRHGNGPFPSDEGRSRPRYDPPSPWRRGVWFEEPHNAPQERGTFPSSDAIHEFGTAGEFRRSPFDAVAFRYAIGVARPDAIAVTHIDSFDWRVDGTWAARVFEKEEEPVQWPVVESYEYFGDDDVHRYLSTGDDGEITGIKGGDISHMECVTRRLFDCYPNTKDVPLNDGPTVSIVNVIQRLGNIPVTIVGEGPFSYRTLEQVKA